MENDCGTKPWSQHRLQPGLECRFFLVRFPPCVAFLAERLAATPAAEGAPPGGGVRADAKAVAKGRGGRSIGLGVGGIKNGKAQLQAPEALHLAFDPANVQEWQPKRFERLGKVQDAVRNRGHVDQMLDAVAGRKVAVKQMPNDWVCESHEAFVRQHPLETEQPWTDIGCTSFLNSVNFPYAVPLLGVYRDGLSTRLVAELASEGDLFSWAGGEAVPAPAGAGAAAGDREALVKPLARQICDSVRRLHELSIVHRDVSMENILLSRNPDNGALRIQVIDFGMTSTGRRFRSCVRGKASYQAPEVHIDEDYDGLLADAFAVGVTLYAALVKDYPWLSTRPGGCKCFDYVRRNGFRAFAARRKLRGSSATVAQCLSPSCIDFLDGLLAVDPARRLTLGESVFMEEGGRRSVWSVSWLSEGLEDVDTGRFPA
mmetsp:Transcript_131926/g.341437  ORF Transcript_131926/g.341437 Transcript_131926/m.341437 type:complete len:429 (+) Transcript_131926:86-1372(+)